MSLRVRLNLLITVMFVTILVLGALLVIHNARRAIASCRSRSQNPRAAPMRRSGLRGS